jgi:hypothetical protein
VIWRAIHKIDVELRALIRRMSADAVCCGALSSSAGFAPLSILSTYVAVRRNRSIPVSLLYG